MSNIYFISPSYILNESYIFFNVKLYFFTFKKVDSVKAEDVRHSILHKKLERAEDSSRKEGILREIEKINNVFNFYLIESD